MSIIWELVSDEAWGAHGAAEELYVMECKAEDKIKKYPEHKGLKYKLMFLRAAQEALGQIFSDLYNKEGNK